MFRPPEPLDEGEVTLDHLAGDWRIHQYRRGHRWSVDDLVVAWVAAGLVAEAPPAALCDLGAGIGTVGLLTLWRLSRGGAGPRRLVMVEAQERSQALARRTVAGLALGGAEVELRLGDLRDDACFPEGERFPLVTGSPPYFPVDRGTSSPMAQRAAARMELRGTIADYARRAARLLTPEGWFAAVFPAADRRGPEAFAGAGLHLRLTQPIQFRHGDAPLVAVYAGGLAPGPHEARAPLPVRGADGRWTEAWLRVREEMGAPERWLAEGRRGLAG